MPDGAAGESFGENIATSDHFFLRKEIPECGDRFGRAHPLAEKMFFLAHPADQIFRRQLHTLSSMTTTSTGNPPISRAIF